MRHLRNNLQMHHRPPPLKMIYPPTMKRKSRSMRHSRSNLQSCIIEMKNSIVNPPQMGASPVCHGAKAAEQDREQMKNLFID